MKRPVIWCLAAALCLCLKGCASAPPPERAADGLDWDESWVTVGGKVGVDTPEGRAVTSAIHMSMQMRPRMGQGVPWSFTCSLLDRERGRPSA